MDLRSGRGGCVQDVVSNAAAAGAAAARRNLYRFTHFRRRGGTFTILQDFWAKARFYRVTPINE